MFEQAYFNNYLFIKSNQQAPVYKFIKFLNLFLLSVLLLLSSLGQQEFLFEKGIELYPYTWKKTQWKEKLSCSESLKKGQAYRKDKLAGMTAYRKDRIAGKLKL